jgi:hypothetical protein
MSHPLYDLLRQGIASSLSSKDIDTCVKWAARRRVMGQPFPGPYTWKYHPWVKELHNSRAPFNFVMKGAQLGVTEAAINRAFYVLDILKRDVLYVLPTSKNASDFSKARFATALSLSPHLTQLFTDTNTVELKQAGTSTLYIRGSRGDSNLKSIAVSEMILDELDEMDQKQIWLALERLSGQLRKCVWGISTPTIPNFGIHKLFQQGSQEHFVFKCPSCSRHIELVWPDNFELIGETVTDPRCHDSFIKCKECKQKLDHRDKPNYLSDGFWKSFLDNPNMDYRTHTINQLYSFTVNPGEIAQAFHRGQGDEYASKEFYNSKVGLPFIGEGAQVNDSEIIRAIGSYCTDDVVVKKGQRRVITLGVDQGKTNYFEVREFFYPANVTSDLNTIATSRTLAYGKFPEEDWRILHELMSQWKIRACVIDADPNTIEARRFARRFPKFVYPCRYRRGKVGKEISINDDDGVEMITVDRTNWLSATLGRYRRGMHQLPTNISEEYKEHQKALVRTYTKVDGDPVATFVETGPDHYAHAACYSEIGLPFAARNMSETHQNIERFL